MHSTKSLDRDWKNLLVYEQHQEPGQRLEEPPSVCTAPRAVLVRLYAATSAVCPFPSFIPPLSYLFILPSSQPPTLPTHSTSFPPIQHSSSFCLSFLLTSLLFLPPYPLSSLSFPPTNLPTHSPMHPPTTHPHLLYPPTNKSEKMASQRKP